MFGHERLDAYQSALTFLGEAGQIIGRLPRGHAYFKDQLGRSALSIVTNIAGGAGELNLLRMTKLLFVPT